VPDGCSVPNPSAPCALPGPAVEACPCRPMASCRSWWRPGQGGCAAAPVPASASGPVRPRLTPAGPNRSAAADQPGSPGEQAGAAAGAVFLGGHVQLATTASSARCGRAACDRLRRPSTRWPFTMELAPARTTGKTSSPGQGWRETSRISPLDGTTQRTVTTSTHLNLARCLAREARSR
jgi:hypothetical protein